MARILGLDLGSHAVKGLLMESAGRGATVTAFGQVRRAEGADRAEALRAALVELLSQHPLQADQVAIALPGPSLATHVLTLPFTDPKRIDATLAFEVESQLPFDLSEAVFDYQVTAQRGEPPDRKSDLLIGVVKKDELRALLDTLGALNLDPRVVTHPALVYHMLLSQPAESLGPVDEGQAVAILDVGHERTSLAIGKPGGGVEFARTFPGGGKELTRALANEFQIAFEDAAAWKEEHGALAGAVNGPDAERAAGAFVRGLQPLLRELRATLKAFTARAGRRSVGRIHLCGGTAQLRGLDEQLTRDLGIPVQRLELPNEVKSAVSGGATAPAAQAYALALRGQLSGARAPRFNLRRGEFAFQGDFDYVRERLGLLASFAAALLILLIASGVVRNSVLARREQQVDAALCDVTQRVLGNCEKDFSRALNLLRGKESPAAAIPKLSAVNLLAELTERIPADVPVTFDNILIDPQRVTLRGETDSSKQVDKLTNVLKAYRCFHEIKQGKVEKSKNSTKVTFNLDIQVECPEAGTAATPQG